MADAKYIDVYDRPGSLVRYTIHTTLYWVFLVGAIGLSRWWFGGHWVIDVSAGLMAFLWFTGNYIRVTGRHVRLTKGQCAEWVRAGQPSDVKAWLDVGN